MNDTMRKFGYPDTLIRDYPHWVVLLRPQQVTLGSLVLICKDEVDDMASQKLLQKLRGMFSGEGYIRE